MQRIPWNCAYCKFPFFAAPFTTLKFIHQHSVLMENLIALFLSMLFLSLIGIVRVVYSHSSQFHLPPCQRFLHLCSAETLIRGISSSMDFVHQHRNIFCFDNTKGAVRSRITVCWRAAIIIIHEPRWCLHVVKIIFDLSGAHFLGATLRCHKCRKWSEEHACTQVEHSTSNVKNVAFQVYLVVQRSRIDEKSKIDRYKDQAVEHPESSFLFTIQNDVKIFHWRSTYKNIGPKSSIELRLQIHFDLHHH